VLHKVGQYQFTHILRKFAKVVHESILCIDVFNANFLYSKIS
jgi:hypothetical protein